MTLESPTGTVKRRPDRTEADRAAFPGLAGSVALFFAAAVFVLAVVDRTHGLPFMPMSWYTNRALWYLIAFASFVAGVVVLRSAGKETGAAADPQRPVFESVVFYTRRGCHLCDDALNVLKRFQQFLPPIRIVDVDTDPSLVERFDTCVPVVEINGKLRFRGRANEVLLQRMIDVELHKREMRIEETG